MLHDSDTDFAITFAGNVTGQLINSNFFFGEWLGGTAGPDTINGSNKGDVILGDAELGGYANDLIYGGDGSDSILGGYGADTIYGGAGADTLTGGGHADRYVFTDLTHSTITAPDRITDFENGVDRIVLTGLGFTSLTDFENLTFASGVTTLHDTNTDFAITFTGDVTGQLDDSDFIFT